LPTPADGAIGALDWTSAERKRLAHKSVNYHCPTCGCKAIELLPALKPKKEGENKSRFQKEIEKLQQLQSLEHAQKVDDESKKEKQKDGKEEAISEGETAAGQKIEPAAREHKLAKEQITDDTSENEAASSEHDVHVLQPEAEQNTNKSESSSEELTATNDNNAKNTSPEEKKKAEVELPNSASDSPVLRIEEPNVQQLQIQQQQQMDAPADDGILSGMVDPVLLGIIVTLAILCFLILRKLQAMMKELNELKRVLDG